MKKKLKVFLRKKPDLFFVTCIVVFVFVASATLAWFASTDARENNFNADFKFKVNLVDEFEEPIDFSPEQLIEKKVTAKNTGDLDAFVRVMVFPVIVDQERVPLLSNNEFEVSYNQLNQTDWLAGEDGYYYYLKKLLPAEETSALFEGVTLVLAEDVKADYQGATFSIEVKSEAVDARKNEYRFSWWGTSPDIPQTTGPLKLVDETLQQILTE